MAKVKTVFFCNNCGAESAKWMGKCPQCGEWNTLVEEVAKDTKHSRTPSVRGVGTNTTKPVALPDIEMSAVSRIPTTYKEIDRVLGGGIVPGALMLLGGVPGIGKSTLLLQVSQKVADTVGTVLYASGEESQLQLKLRAERLHINSERLHVIADTDLDHILEVALDQKPSLLVIDSIQTMFTADIEAAPGSVSQVRECTSRLLRFCKEQNMINEEKVKIMTKLAMYEQGKGRKYLPVSRYYRSDYIGLALIKNFFLVTIGYALIVAAVAVYFGEYLLENIHKMDLVTLGVYLWWFLSHILY